MSCKHDFIGIAEGVKCSLCGKQLSTDEFRSFLRGEKVEPKKEATPEKSETLKKAIRPKKTTKK